MAKGRKVTAVPGQGIPAVVDPNPARTASDVAEAKAEEVATAEAIEQKQANEAEHQEQVQENIQEQQAAHEAKEDAADEAFANLPERPSVVEALMTQHNVNELFENSKGEYFLELNLAVNSEGGVKERVKTHNR